MTERCLSSCVIAPGEHQLKRCQGEDRHVGPHYWISAVRSGGGRKVVRWFGTDADRPDSVEDFQP